MEVLGKEEFQWFFTKFSTVTGFVKPFFEAEDPKKQFKGQTHKAIIQRRALPISDTETSAKLLKLLRA